MKINEKGACCARLHVGIEEGIDSELIRVGRQERAVCRAVAREEGVVNATDQGAQGCSVGQLGGERLRGAAAL